MLHYGRRAAIEMVDAHGLSSAVSLKDGDIMAEVRDDITTRSFSIDSINPAELRGRFDAPEFIDYMSLDVEGCEMDVLRSMNLEYYKIALMTVERSEDRKRQSETRDFLSPLGYKAIDRHYDDWF